MYNNKNIFFYFRFQYVKTLVTSGLAFNMVLVRDKKKLLDLQYYRSTVYFLITKPHNSDRESSTSSIDVAAFIELTPDNDERTNALENQSQFTPHQSQGKKEEQCQKEREKRTDRRKMSSIKENEE